MQGKDTAVRRVAARPQACGLTHTNTHPVQMRRFKRLPRTNYRRTNNADTRWGSGNVPADAREALNRIRQMRGRQLGSRKALCSSAVAVTDPGINHV